MSGGHFNYDQHRIDEIADEVSRIIRDSGKRDEYGYSTEYSIATLSKFKKAEKTLRLAAKMTQRIDWLICSDDDEGSFHERWEEEINTQELDEDRIREAFQVYLGTVLDDMDESDRAIYAPDYEMFKAGLLVGIRSK